MPGNSKLIQKRLSIYQYEIKNNGKMFLTVAATDCGLQYQIHVFRFGKTDRNKLSK